MQHEKGATRKTPKKYKKNCYSALRKNVQYEKKAVRKKVQHEKMKRAQDEKKCNTDGKSATQKVCHTKKEQHEKSAT